MPEGVRWSVDPAFTQRHHVTGFASARASVHRAPRIIDRTVTRAQRLSIALGLNGLLVAGQVVFGLVANSMGLLADAAHNLSDIAALGMAMGGVLLSRRLPTPGRSYG